MSIAEAFGKAADYDRHAGIQKQVAERLAERIAALALPRHPRVLEIGCGTGFLGAALIDRLPGARWTMTDIAPAMIDRARARFAGRSHIDFAVMDGEAPDLPGRFDLICSSLAAQWFADLPEAVAKLASLLAPGGWLAFTTLAAGSFVEWRKAQASPAGTHDYPDASALRSLGLDVAIEAIPVRHESARSFLRALKAIGAGTPRAGHRPLPPAELREAMRQFEAGGAVVTYQIATCLLRRGGEEAAT